MQAKTWWHRLIPQSLITRMLCLTIVSVVLAQGFSSLIWVSQFEARELEGLQSNSSNMALSAVSTVKFFKRLPVKFRHIVLDQLRNMGGSRFFVSLNSEEILIQPIPDSKQKAMVLDEMSSVLKNHLGSDIKMKVEFSRPENLHVLNNEILLSELPPSWASYSLLMDSLQPPILVLQIEIAQDEWLYLAAVMPPPYMLLDRDIIPSQQLTTIILTSLFLLVFIYLLFRWQTRPLKRLAQAASEMSIDLEQPPLKEEGATELVAATRAFNSMQQKLQKYLSDRERLFSSISHDLKTPITRLRLRVELLDDETKTDKFNSDLDDLEMMVKGAVQTVKDTDIHENIEDIEILKLINQIVETQAENTRVQGHYVAPFRGKPLALKRCLSNLIDNGVKYGKQVVVSAMDHKDTLIISVKDQGPGIPEKELERIFDPYVQLSKQNEGYGLGLGIVRNIVHAHGGDIELINIEQGGLEVRLSFPRTHYMEH